MNILVTGAGGFISSHLAKHLAEQGHRVTGTVHDKLPMLPCDDVQYIDLNVCNYARVLEVVVNEEIEQIYHLAAKSIVSNANQDPVGCFTTNVIGTANILEAARQSGRVQGIAVWESDKAYGPSMQPYRETDRLCPAGIYEASKSCVSHLVTSYHATYDLPVFGIRSANVYGVDHNSSRIIPRTITRLLDHEKPVITEGADNFLREYIYIDDETDIAIKLMDAQPWGQSVNVGSGCCATVLQVIFAICDIMDHPREYQILPRNRSFVEIPSQQLNLALLDRLISRSPPTPLHEGLVKTIQGYLDYHETSR